MPASATRPMPCAFLIAVLVGLAGCDRRVEPWIDPTEEPPPPSRPVRIPGLASPEASPLGREEVAAEAGDQSISGTLRVETGAPLPEGAVVFVIARSREGGPPLAVRRLEAGPFPMAFAIGPGDAMLGQRSFAGAILLSARVDGDGDPLTRQASDLAALASTPVEPGASGVDLVLRPAPAQ